MLKSQAAPRKSARMKSPAIMASKDRMRRRKAARLKAKFVDEGRNGHVEMWPMPYRPTVFGYPV